VKKNEQQKPNKQRSKLK